jgi:hypothetical protein
MTVIINAMRLQSDIQRVWGIVLVQSVQTHEMKGVRERDDIYDES